jgi:hypothetical protein
LFLKEMKEETCTHITTDDPGGLAATPAALDALVATNTHPLTLLRRHATGDWGDLCAEDQEANRLALALGGRVLSAYTLPSGERVWVITEADRSATTILCPEDH